MNLLNRFLFVLIFLCSSLFAFAGNDIRIIPDSTNRCAKFEISRTKKATFKLVFKNEKGTIIHKRKIIVEDKPQIISLDWSMYEAGIFFVELKKKSEKVKLMFIKK